MSDSSGPHRPEELESRVQKMMDMTSQLLKAKSAGGGRRREEEESGGNGRGAPTTTAAAPGGRCPLLTQVMVLQQSELQQLRTYPSTAEEQRPNKPAGDIIGRRPEAPAGIGPTVNVYSGEGRGPHLAGIAARNGNSGVLNPSFHGQPRVTPPVLKGGKGFQKLEHNFLLKANMLDISDHFVRQRVRSVPVGHPLKQKAVLLWEGLSPEEI